MKTIILIELSEGCNLDCTYCLQNKRSKHKLNINDFKYSFDNIISKIDHNKCTGIQFDFYGGEPLLYFDLIKEIIAYLLYRKREVFFKDIPFTYHMPSNLLPLNNEKIAFIVKYKINISFSYDGLNQDNRPLLNGGSSIQIYDEKTEKIKGFIRLLKMNKIGFKIHTMIFPSFKILDNFNYIFEKFGVEPEFKIIRDHGVWSEKSIKEICCGLNELRIESIEKNRIHPLFIAGIHKIMQYKIDGYTANCGAGVTNFSILDNGEVRSCERLKNQPDDPNILEYNNNDKCNNCRIKNYCDKGCPYETKNGGVVDICVYYKTYFDLCLKFIETVKNNQTMQKHLKIDIKNYINRV